METKNPIYEGLYEGEKGKKYWLEISKSVYESVIVGDKRMICQEVRIKETNKED